MITYQIFHLSLPPHKTYFGAKTLFRRSQNAQGRNWEKLSEEKIRKANKGCCNEWIIHVGNRGWSPLVIFSEKPATETSNQAKESENISVFFLRDLLLGSLIPPYL